MAAKPAAASPESSATAALAQHPPNISLSSHVLSSALKFPSEPVIAYAIYSTSGLSTVHSENVELARREVLRRRTTTTNTTGTPVVNSTKHGILESMLASVLVERETLHLYVFGVSSVGETMQWSETLKALDFDGLTLSKVASFSPADLYPCSPECASLDSACNHCIDPSVKLETLHWKSEARYPPSLRHLPREPLRRPYAQFLQAVRERLTDDMCESSKDGRRLRRLKDGFLIFPPSDVSDWGLGWEHHSRNRPLIHCYLHLFSTPTRILIQPIFRPSYFLPILPILPSLTIPAGTPVTLLPYGTPAYYLTTYAGPTSALTAQFSQSLAGLGCADWHIEYSPRPPHNRDPDASSSTKGPTYVIAWINVQNKHGEEKGLTVIWPASLTLTFVPSSPSPHARQSLTIIPQLPAQLQPSPPAAPHPIPSNFPSLASHGHPGSSTSAHPSPTTSTFSAYTPPAANPLPPALSRSRSTPAASLRAIALGKSMDLNVVASEVAGYVDLMAKERERQRETMRKGRDSATLASPVPTLASAPIPAPGPSRSEQGTVRPPITVSTTPVPASVGSTMTLGSSPLAGSSSQPHVVTPQQSHPLAINPHQGTFHPSSTGNISASQSAPAATASAFEASGPVSASASLPINMAESNTAGDVDIKPSVAGPSTIPNTFDLYDTYADWPVAATTSSWPQPTSSGFMGMDIDGISGNTMPFSSDISMNGGGWGTGAGDTAPGGSAAGVGVGMDMDTDMDDIFTDADFDFFDAKPAVSGPIATPGLSTGLTPNAGPASMGLDIGMSPSFFGDTTHLPGPGPPSGTTPAPSQTSPWVPGALAESFATPHADGHLGADGVASVPDLIPASPTKTPSSYSAPTTPAVHIAPEAEVKIVGAKPDLSRRGSAFDPIPFAAVHKLADGKYTAGKFALSSPPPEDDKAYTFPIHHLSRSVPSKIHLPPVDRSLSGWARKYADATDPRVGLVKKLVGVRRKSTDEGLRRTKLSPFASCADEEWEADILRTPSDQDAEMDDADDADSDSEDNSDEQQWGEDEETLPGTRPSTPVPSYLPLGPTLLHTYFNHSELLSLSSPLKTPGSAVSPPAHLTAGSGPMSVPTPVSPAAVLGAASEKSKSLEAAAGILAREAVESSVWDAAWRSNATGHDQSRSTNRNAKSPLVAEVWQSDIKRVLAAFRSVPNLEAPLDLKTVFRDSASAFSASSLSSSQSSQSSTKSRDGPSTPYLEALEPTMLSVGKGSQITQVLPTALNFWEKLGLEPRSGKKDVVAFVFYEDDDDGTQDMEDGEARMSEIQAMTEEWLKWMGKAYAAKNMGSHTAGRAKTCVKDGLVPVKFETFRRTLTDFVKELPAPTANYVFYIATPSSIISMSSPVLRQVLSAVKRAQKIYSEAQILFQFLPAHLIQTLQYPQGLHSGPSPFILSIYDRILRPVDRVMSRRFFEHGERTRSYFQDPAFLIGRSSQRKVHLTREPHPRVLDVLERHTFMHLGYRISSCGKWIFAACVDERGEAHDLGVWLAQKENLEAHLVLQLWAFAMGFAKKASMEWRIVISKLGSMSAYELDAWVNHLEAVIPDGQELPMVHVSLLSVDLDAPWTFIAPHHASKRPTSPHRPSKSAANNSVIVDNSSSNHRLTHRSQMTLLPSSPQDFASQLPYIPDPGDLSPLPSSALSPSPSLFTSISLFTPSPTSAWLTGLPLRPLRTTTVIRAPCTPDHTSISMLHVHLLHTIKSAESTISDEEEENTPGEVVANFHELCLLGRARWGLGVRSGADGSAKEMLPCHLGALEVMDAVLSGGFDVDGT